MIEIAIFPEGQNGHHNKDRGRHPPLHADQKEPDAAVKLPPPDTTGAATREHLMKTRKTISERFPPGPTTILFVAGAPSVIRYAKIGASHTAFGIRSHNTRKRISGRGVLTPSDDPIASESVTRERCSWDGEKVFLKDQVDEVRHAIRRRLATCGS
jgi:hypothetical protein